MEHTIYEHLKHEKMTPAFLKLAKIKSSDDSLTQIKKPDGTDFDNDEDRNAFITNFYEQLYRKPVVPVPQTPAHDADIIRNFLGEEVFNSEQVQNAILPQAVSDSLEHNITLEELDNALKQCKNSSAPGSDGIPYSFIKKFWHFLRTPLCNYAAHSFENGELTQSFKCASIRLIPKKR